MVKCNSCKYQVRYFHQDRRYKEGGYYGYWCELCDDPFGGHPVTGQPDEYCSSGVLAEGGEANER